MAINISQLNEGSNAAEWILVINDWSGGVLMLGLMLIMALIIFGISKASGTEDVKAFAGTSFLMFLVSGVAWFIRWNDLQMVSTFAPLFFLFMSGLGVLFILIGDRVFNNS